MKDHKFESYVYLDADEMIETFCTVEFDYQPAEKMAHNYPGCSEEVELVTVADNSGTDVIDELSDYDKDRLEQEALEFMERDYDERP